MKSEIDFETIADGSGSPRYAGWTKNQPESIYADRFRDQFCLFTNLLTHNASFPGVKFLEQVVPELLRKYVPEVRLGSLSIPSSAVYGFDSPSFVYLTGLHLIRRPSKTISNNAPRVIHARLRKA